MNVTRQNVSPLLVVLLCPFNHRTRADCMRLQSENIWNIIISPPFLCRLPCIHFRYLTISKEGKIIKVVFVVTFILFPFLWFRYFFFDKADVLHFFFLSSRFLFDKLQLAPVHDIFHLPRNIFENIEKNYPSKRVWTVSLLKP